jgi:hypothetical protein
MHIWLNDQYEGFFFTDLAGVLAMPRFRGAAVLPLSKSDMAWLGR